ncbi:MAG: glycoside hydrolase family 28 protein [Lachnospiraceae bacterium]|nr:glycoside hydrolase family 28 protein [Lachnospiraceae bacterium]
MDFKIIDIQPTQITIELDNDTPYKPVAPVRLFLDGEGIGEFDVNVITVDGMVPDSLHSLRVTDTETGAESSVDFRTRYESVLLDIRSFGATGDGVRNDTAAVQAAIYSCPADGTVYVGKGTYLCDPLFLKSNIRIHLDEGAVILGAVSRDEYPVLPGMTCTTDETGEYNLGTWEGNPLDCFASLITGINVENISVYGRGCIDGNADKSDWWDNPKVRRGAWRPRLVYLCNCKNVTLSGIRAVNSPSWSIHPYYSDHISVIDVTIRNPDNSPNTDGIDPESCSHVNIVGADISVGDDCIAIKSGKYYMARKHYKQTSGVTVRNCVLNHGHGSVTIGSECACGVRDVLVTKCIFDSTDRGLRIKSRRGRGSGSILDNIVFDNIYMKDVRMPFTVNMFYFCDPDGHSEYCQCKEPLPVDELTPEIRSIEARNIRCTGVDVTLLTVYGLPERKVGLISLENINADFRPESERIPAVPVMMDGMDPMSGVGIYARNVSELRMNNIIIHGITDKGPDVDGVDMITGII